MPDTYTEDDLAKMPEADWQALTARVREPADAVDIKDIAAQRCREFYGRS